MLLPDCCFAVGPEDTLEAGAPAACVGWTVAEDGRLLGCPKAGVAAGTLALFGGALAVGACAATGAGPDVAD